MNINLLTLAYTRHKHPLEVGDDPSNTSGKLLFEFDDRCWSEGRTAPDVGTSVIRGLIALSWVHASMLQTGEKIPIPTGRGANSRNVPALEKMARLANLDDIH